MSGRPHRGKHGGGPQKREGDWTCPNCKANNFANRQSCYSCKTDKDSGSGGFGTNKGEEWTCQQCNYSRNFASRNSCYRCNAKKYGDSEDRGSGYGRGERHGGRGRGRGRGFESHAGPSWGGVKSSISSDSACTSSDAGQQSRLNKPERGSGHGRGGRGRGRGQGQEGGSRAVPSWGDSPTSPIQSDTASSSFDAGDLTRNMNVSELHPELANEDLSRWSMIPARSERGLVVGTKGRKIKIEVNHYPLSIGSPCNIALHYDCSFEPDNLSRKVLRRVMNMVQTKHFNKRSPAFDGKKNLYSSGKTPLFDGEELQDTVVLPRENNDKEHLKVKVTLKKVNEIDMTRIQSYISLQSQEFPQLSIQVLDIVLRNPAANRLIAVGRSFFSPPQRALVLGNGLELWHGFYQSAVLGWKLFLNVDVAHKGFPQGKNVVEIMCDMKTKRRGDPPFTPEQLIKVGYDDEEREKFSKYIKGIRIEYEIPGIPSSRRKYTVNVVKKPANQTFFCLKRNANDEGEEISVEKYYAEEKRYKLKYPELPVLHVGNPKGTTFLPPELCKIVRDQIIMKKLDPEQTRSMVRAAAKPPQERKDKIMESVSHVGYHQDKCMKEFGISVDTKFTEVPARILSPPSIEYKNQKVDVKNGEWRAQIFKEPKPLNKWVVVSASAYIGSHELSSIVSRFMQVSLDVGMEVNKPMEVDQIIKHRTRMHKDDLKRLLSTKFQEYKHKGAQIAVIVIPSDAYSQVKQVSELEVGFLTQCILEKTMAKMDCSTAKNLLLKINAKLNGINHTINENISERAHSRVIELLKGVMLMGADVTHPSPDQKSIPSIAAVTASHDPLQFLYNMKFRLQPPRTEIIRDFHLIVVEQLKYYMEKNNGRPPAKIIIYRDGVSEGEFIKVLMNEMTAIKWACRTVLGKELPVTFLVVQKRHHTRFFPTSKDHQDRKGNVLPGTVVDTHITHPREFDFYMVSHASLQGTSRPTKYHVLWDDNKINADDLEEMTYFLCHMFSRCTRAVSYPAPTYYAHLGAFRGRSYVDGATINMTELAREMENRTIQTNIVNGSPMFFT